MFQRPDGHALHVRKATRPEGRHLDICQALGIDSPKDAMDGSMVAPAYESGRIAEIATYNRQDVRATAAVYRAARDLVLRFRDDWA